MKLKTIVIYCILLFVVIQTKADKDTMNKVSFASHNLMIDFDIANQKALISDQCELEIVAGTNSFKINKTADIKTFTISGSPINYDAVVYEDSVFKLITFDTKQTGTYPCIFSFSAVINDPIENVRFSNENVGNEVNGTILENGAYLSPDIFYYPTGVESEASYAITVSIPATWESVADGNRLASKVEGDRKIQSWENPYKSNALMFMAAPYLIKTTNYKDIEISCYFFEEDTALFDGYLSAATNYMEIYTDMIGAYPYKSFIIAENFFPTGFGMPGWTLLGQQVIRLPFIKFTSLGHEVLHNWWGNSVYVDYERGNWCEAAAVYGADYHYKLQRSEDAAKNYRKDILKQYISYVNEGNDFPISDFTSRTSPGTRTIGYNKGMMVYHMIEEEIGTDAFWSTWRTIYNKYITKKISWDEWINEFEISSGKNLSYIIPQWINRTGAPEISLHDIKVVKESNNKRITFKLNESSGQAYSLNVPIRFSGKDFRFDTTITLANNEQIYQLVTSAAASKIEIDPDYHLFRRLYPEEVEPIISAVLGYDERVYAANMKDSVHSAIITEFGTNIEEDASEFVPVTGLSNNNPNRSLVILNPADIPSYLDGKCVVKGDSVYVSGQAFPGDGYTFILTGDNWNGFEKYMVVLTSDFASLPRLGQLIPHYGKYSYLVFEGAKNIAKGQWDISASPLKAEL